MMQDHAIFLAKIALKSARPVQWDKCGHLNASRENASRRLVYNKTRQLFLFLLTDKHFWVLK